MSTCLKVFHSNKPFPDYGTGKDNYTFYEPNQFVLGAGTWLEGWQIYQTADILEGQGCWFCRYLSGSGYLSWKQHAH